MRWLVQYFREVFCRHEWKLEEAVLEYIRFGGNPRLRDVHQVRLPPLVRQVPMNNPTGTSVSRGMRYLVLVFLVACGGPPFSAATIDESLVLEGGAVAVEAASEASAESDGAPAIDGGPGVIGPAADSGSGGQDAAEVADGQARDGGDGGLEDAAPDGPALVCPVTHTDGIGQTWSDCVALATYNEAQALKACNAFAAVHGGVCAMSSCPTTAGGFTMVCTQATCVANWVYTGPVTGHVGPAGIGCVCPTTSDPVWQ